jgi:hypothetical protein
MLKRISIALRGPQGRRKRMLRAKLQVCDCAQGAELTALFNRVDTGAPRTVQNRHTDYVARARHLVDGTPGFTPGGLSR